MRRPSGNSSAPGLGEWVPQGGDAWLRQPRHGPESQLQLLMFCLVLGTLDTFAQGILRTDLRPTKFLYR